MNPRPEIFTAIFSMYRVFYEDPQLRNNIARDVWLTALNDIGGSPAENEQVQIVQSSKYHLGCPMAGDSESWDSMRIKVQGRAYRTSEERVTLDIQAQNDEALERISRSMQQYLADPNNVQESCDCVACLPSLDEDDLDTSVPQRIMQDPHYEDDGYPWTDSATWYPEYADED